MMRGENYIVPFHEPACRCGHVTGESNINIQHTFCDSKSIMGFLCSVTSTLHVILAFIQVCQYTDTSVRIRFLQNFMFFSPKSNACGKTQNKRIGRNSNILQKYMNVCIISPSEYRWRKQHLPTKLTHWIQKLFIVIISDNLVIPIIIGINYLKKNKINISGTVGTRNCREKSDEMGQRSLSGGTVGTWEQNNSYKENQPAI